MAPVTLNNNVDKLTWNVPIVNSDGSPTNEFMRKWAQQGQTNASVPDLTTAKAVSAVIDLISSTVGALLVRGATQWTGLVPVADGRVLRDKGVGATPIWDTISDILDTIGSTRGNVLSRGASQWGALAIGGANTILHSDGTDPSWASLSSLLDTLGNARGDVLFRGAAGWTVLIPGTGGNVLTTAGAGADPFWTAPASGGGGAASIQDDGTNLYVALSDTDGQLVLDGSGDPIFSKEVLPVSSIPNPAGYVTGPYSATVVNKVKGITDGSSAAAGDVGELIQQITNFASAVTYTAGATPNIAQITLTPGDWDVSGVCALFASTCSFSSVAFGISQTTGTLPSVTTDAQGSAEISTPLTSSASNIFGISPFTVSVTVNTIMYLCVNAAFTGAGTPKVWGTIRARRMR